MHDVALMNSVVGEGGVHEMPKRVLQCMLWYL